MKNLLYITPHLSTGGAPQYLFKKIELLNEIYNIYVLEYNDHGHFRVQKNKIVSLLGERHKTLGVNKEEIFDFIKYSSPNIIHFVEMPEFFMHDHISKIIYSNDRPYKIFETSHDSSFNPNNKKFFPDKILFCSSITSLLSVLQIFFLQRRHLRLRRATRGCSLCFGLQRV